MSTKERLVVSAKKLIAERGYSATKVEDITNDAQVAKGTFYTYFKTKEDIFIEILKNIFKLAQEKMNEIQFENELKKDLHKFITFMYEGAFNDKGNFKIISNIFTNPELMTKVIELAPKKDLFSNAIKSILLNCKNEVREDVCGKIEYIYSSINEFIKEYMGRIFGMEFPCVELKEFKEITQKELEEHIDFLTDFLYRALKK